MNHLRQQALGNIVITLYMGAKTFLDRRIPIYMFFKNLNTHVFDIDELPKKYKTMLSTKQILNNRQVLRKYWSREIIIQKAKNLIQAAIRA